MTNINVIQPGTIEAAPGEIPFLLLPERSLFQRRAARLRTLAEGHALADYLRFLAALATAQHASMYVFRHVPLPGPQEIERCREHGMPTLGTMGWKRDPAWREALRSIVKEVETATLPDATRATIAQLKDTDDASLERLAERLLAGDDDEKLDRAAVPFIGAALQAYWLQLVTTVGVDAFDRLEVPHLCPACGSAPMVSVVGAGAGDHGLRYLTCSLCNTQWHAVRIKCVFCDTTKGIAYYGIEGGSGAVKAERCEACQGYLKILYMEKDPDVDALADDVASVALDVLMAESGFTRNGANFFLY
jgi:FdhE protein